MRTFLAVALLAFAANAQAQELHLPFKGRWFVMQAGDTLNVNQQQGSVRVKPGQLVAAGEELGTCGNSGNSDAPHVHMHIQDTPALNEGQGQNMIFTGINAELTGKSFENVTWPLIRGLFVWNE